MSERGKCLKATADLRSYLLRRGYWTRDNGVIFPPLVSSDNLNAVRKFEVMPDRSGVLFFVSYPKSGTSWLKYIACHIVFHKHPEVIKELDKIRGIKSILSCLEYSSPETGEPNHAEISNKLKSCNFPMALSTYLRENMAPEGLIKSNHKVIFVVRNPKDVCISQLKTLLSEKDLQTRTDVGRYVDQFIEGNVPFGSWFDHTLSWWKYRNSDKVLLLTYEELYTDIRKTIEKVADFLGQSLSSDYIDQICKKCCLDKMSCNGHDVDNKDDDDFRDTINDGPVGEWKDYFTVTQSEKFNVKFRSRFVGTGLEDVIPLD